MLRSLLLPLAFAFASVATVSAAEEKPLLKVFHDDEHTDTVYSSTYYVVGVTHPGAKAWVNGEEVHVYKTGSFGAKINLKPGENTITLKAKEGKKTEQAKSKVFLKEGSRKASLLPSTTALATPVNVTTKPGAYLQNGNGGDRLGGSKMGYINENIAMTAVGETKDLYKVQLSDNRYAYLPKEYADLSGNGRTTVNTGSWSITNDGKTDRVLVSLPCRLPYVSKTEIDPGVIKVSLFGATNNSNWITQRSETEMIQFVDFDQEESDVLTVVIRLKDKYMWGYSVEYEGTNLVIKVRHTPKSLNLKDLVIGLDAGHGGEYPGAISPSGLKEKDVNLDIILNIAKLLTAEGAKVVLTRDGDTGPSMTERKQIWREGNVDLAISVHNNASGNPLIRLGTSSYYKHIQNRALAKALHSSMLTLDVANFGLTGNFNFSLNGPTEYPNALVEVLFMSSLPEEELLADPEYRVKIASKIVDGLKNYLEEVKKSL